MSEFAYVTCLVGAEGLLKADLAQRYPGLRPAFMKPGFITLKSDGPLPLIRGPFVQAAGKSLGLDEPGAREKLPSQKAGLCVFGPALPPEEVDDLGRELGESLATTPLADLPAGAPVIDVIVLEGGKRWLGTHAYDPDDHLHPGVYRPSLPEAAPSRAYLKLEEALLFSGAVTRPGERALELGAAPGGAAYALLLRGLKVTGIDPAGIDPIVLRNPKFVHVPYSINVLADAKIPPADWVFSDMNVPPEQTLKAVLRLVEHCRPLGAFLTLKLKDQKSARFLETDKNDLLHAGFEEAGLRQLPSHRSEVLLYGLSKAAVLRKRA